MKQEKFDAMNAAKALLNIMKHMGINTDKPAHDTWINEDSKENAVICLGCNFIKCSVTKDGFSFSVVMHYFLCGRRDRLVGSNLKKKCNMFFFI